MTDGAVLIWSLVFGHWSSELCTSQKGRQGLELASDPEVETDEDKHDERDEDG